MVSQIAMVIIGALAGVGGAAAGSAVQKGVIQSDFRDTLIKHISGDTSIPPEVQELLRDLPFPDVLTYAQTAIDRALATVTDPEAVAALMAVKELLYGIS